MVKGERIQSPSTWGIAGEMWRTEDKRSSLYYNVLKKGYLYFSPIQILSRLLCYCCLILGKKILHSLIFPALLSWVLEPGCFLFVCFLVFLFWKKEMELGRDKAC